MSENKVNHKADKLESKVRSGTEVLESKIHEGAKKVDEATDGASDDAARAAKRAEDEVNRLKAELAELRRNVGPKIQEAENYLTSPTAITFYKGIVTGVALVLAFKKYAEKN